MSESERRSGAKLHKQPEVEDDDGDEAHQHHDVAPETAQSQTVTHQCGSNSGDINGLSTSDPPTTSTASVAKSEDGTAHTNVNISGVRTPTIQSASSSSETSPDEGQIHPPVTATQPVFTRKQTLTRTQALEGTSPPPDSLPGQQSHVDGRGSSLDVPSHSLTNGGSRGAAEALSGQVPGSASPVSLGTLQKKGGQSASQEAKEFLLASQKVSNDSGHGTLDTTDAGSDTSVLSRDSSLENSAANLYKDSSGVDIPRFIRETMLKSTKDKKTVLAYEKQLIDFCRNETLHELKMAEASSYDRMIAHRLSAFMGLEHNVDSTGKSVIINKTENMRILKITDFIKLDDAEQETKKKILLKKPASLDEKHSRGASKGQFGSHRAKSLEEREKIYSEVRERIFKDGENQGDTLNPPSLLTTHCSMPQLHHQRSLDSARPSCLATSTSPILPSMSSTAATPSSLSHPEHLQQPPHQPYQQHHHHLHPARWSSTDSAPGNSRSGQGAADLRASTMIKSNSYGGVGSSVTSVPGFVRSELSPSAVTGYIESQKDVANMYNNPVSQVVAPPSLCPLPGSSTDQTSTQQTASEEVQASMATGAAEQQQQQQQSHHQQQQSQAVSQACPNTPVAYLISSDYTSIPLGSLIIDPNTMQPHVNADGSLYRFNPSCPPPFMTQPVIQPSPPAGQLSYQMDHLSVSEVGGKYPAAGLDPASAVTGQLVMSHPQAALTYPSSHPIQFSQGQYYPSMSPSPVPLSGQSPFQVLAYAPAAPPMTPSGQGHQIHAQQQILRASPLEAQGQATVPMPTVGVPGVPPNLSGATTYVLSPAPYDIGSVGAGGGVTMYTPYPQGVETLGSGGMGGPIAQQQLVQYNIAAYGQPQPQLQHQLQQQQPQQPQQQPQVMVPHSGAGHTAYFTAVQAATSGSNPTPPPHHPSGIALSQLPPPPQPVPVSLKASSQTHSVHHTQHQLQQQQGQQPHNHHQQQQPPVFYSPGLSNLTMSSLTPVFPSPVASNPQPSSIVMAPPSSTNSIASNPKAGQSPYIQYHSSPPPPPPAHHQQSLSHHQHQVVAAAPSNGHHHSHPQQQLTLSCSGQPLPLCPTSSSGPSSAPRGGPVPQQLVAYHPVRPVGTIVHLGGGPSVQPLVQPSPMGPTQLQPYQILRPTGPELRMMNHGSMRPRLTSLQFSSPHNQQCHAKPLNRQSRKGPKRNNSESKDVEDISIGGESGGSGMRPPQTVLGAAPNPLQPQYQHPQQQQQPVLVTPLLSGMVGQPHIPQAPSQTRQDPPARL